MSPAPTPKSGILDISPYVGGKSQGKPGVKAVKLSSNETPLGASPAATKAYAEASQMLHRYPDGHAVKLREAIAEIHKLPIDNIVCGAGSDELIGLLIHAYAGQDDEVLISQHGFLMYKIYAQSFGAMPVFAPEKNLTTDVDAMLKAVTPRTKIVCIANPNNPTGSYISKVELKRLHDGLPPHVVLAIDGAYSEYAEISPLPLREGIKGRGPSTNDAPPTQPSSSRGEGLVGDYSSGYELVANSENVVMLRTFSKIYGLSALRIGWAYAPAAIIDVLNRIRGPFNVSNPAIAAAAAAMRDTAFTAKAKAFNSQWLAWLAKEIAALGLKVHPSIANFILVEFKDAKTASAASAFLANKGLIVREVANYGLPACLRITIGLEEDNRAVVAALAEFLK